MGTHRSASLGESTDVVVFESESFQLELAKTEGVPSGDDLAKHLAERLRARFPGVAIDDPIVEDWGTVIHVEDARSYWLNIHWAPLSNTSENTWAIQFAVRRGCLGSLLGRSPPAHASCRPVMERVNAVLQEDPVTFRNVRWLTDHEFHARY